MFRIQKRIQNLLNVKVDLLKQLLHFTKPSSYDLGATRLQLFSFFCKTDLLLFAYSQSVFLQVKYNFILYIYTLCVVIRNETVEQYKTCNEVMILLCEKGRFP